MSLHGKVIVITGGGRGLGREIALACSSMGAKVVVLARSKPELEDTVVLIKKNSGNVALGFQCDVADQVQVDQTFALIEKEVGPIYGLICAAAIYGPIGPIEDISLESWEQAIDINLMGTVRCLAAVLKGMKQRREGRIVLFSGGGEGKMPRFSAYVASKGAIWRLTETVAAETFEHGVYINAIAPGAVNTKLLNEVLEAGPEKVGVDLYQKALKQKESGGSSPEKAANLILYLMSEKAKGLSGKILSALWDDYQSFSDIQKITDSALYNFRRVTSLPELNG